MKTFKFLLLFVFGFSLIGCASAQIKKRITAEKSKNTNVKTSDKTANEKLIDKPSSVETKSLAEGAYSKIREPFVFVAREPETYAQLQSLVEDLPAVSKIDFNKSAIVAGFAGTKNSGGYSVSIKSVTGKVSVDVINPPKDALVTMALTSPFNVALVPLGENNSLNLELSANWKNAIQTYKVTSGAFEYSGGFRGMQKKFDAEGTIGVLSFGDYTTLFFNLAGKGAEKTRKLTEPASGWLRKENVELARLDAGSFSEHPKPPLKVSGTISGGKLSLVFEPLPTTVADGFQARGKIEAAKVN
jgi:hypothetical protein